MLHVHALKAQLRRPIDVSTLGSWEWDASTEIPLDLRGYIRVIMLVWSYMED